MKALLIYLFGVILIFAIISPLVLWITGQGIEVAERYSRL